jgi:hypothetical protein
MPSRGASALGVALALAAASLVAQAETAATPSSRPAPTAVPAADPQSPARVNTRGEPAVQQRVLEDDQIIIEELVVRGQPVRITVRGKGPGARAYEVNVGPGGRDASQESGRAGQSAWRLFSF